MDDFVVSYLPPGIGEMVSDFAYEWADVAFTSRVWEREVEDGYRVDLQVIVLRGPALTSITAVRDFLAGYHEHDPAVWTLGEFRTGDLPGLIGDSEAFWLVEPGTAVLVRIAPDRFDGTQLLATALGVRPAEPDSVASPPQ